jgi:RNA polymerase sigma factor (sigma-70 family)
MAPPSSQHDSPAPAAPGGLFPVTSWTLVQRAVSGEDDRQLALNELFERYWRPIYIYLRRSGRGLPESEDLTQAFFVHLMEKDLLERVRVRQSRFRAYLRSVLEHFLANESRTASAQKRRCEKRCDFAEAEAWLTGRPEESPGHAFDRIWAVERLERAFGRLRQELVSAGREWVAEALVRRSGLRPDADVASVQALSRQFGVTENQLSVALHRAKQRLRELILEEIRDSVGSAEEADEELNDMFRALRHPATERSEPM